jgi:hypothetical protein
VQMANTLNPASAISHPPRRTCMLGSCERFVCLVKRPGHAFRQPEQYICLGAVVYLTVSIGFAWAA